MSYNHGGSLKAPKLVFAKRESVSAAPDRSASQVANGLFKCSFHHFSLIFGLRSPMEAKSRMTDSMNDIVLTSHNAS